MFQFGLSGCSNLEVAQMEIFDISHILYSVQTRVLQCFAVMRAVSSLFNSTCSVTVLVVQ